MRILNGTVDYLKIKKFPILLDRLRSKNLKITLINITENNPTKGFKK